MSTVGRQERLIDISAWCSFDQSFNRDLEEIAEDRESHDQHSRGSQLTLAD
jgi:hypothetical protein